MSNRASAAIGAFAAAVTVIIYAMVGGFTGLYEDRFDCPARSLCQTTTTEASTTTTNPVQLGPAVRTYTIPMDLDGSPDTGTCEVTQRTGGDHALEDLHCTLTKEEPTP